MKTTLSKIAALAIFVFAFTSASATLRRVNNNLTTDKTKKVYASLQEAHDDSSPTAGDTLLVEGSTKEYTTLNCTHKVVVIGTGFFLSNNPGQQSAIASTVQNINFGIGSEGSVIIGLTFSSQSNNYRPNINTSGIAIIRCYLTNGIVVNVNITSLVLLQNYVASSDVIFLANNNITFGGVILKNNIFIGDLEVPSSAAVPRVFAAVEHNIFNGWLELVASSFRSNIVTDNAFTFTVVSNAVQNNLTLGTQLNTVPTNQSYTAASNLFISAADAAGSPDGKFKVSASSPFAKAGYNGEEPGVFGGTEPYVLSGLPPVPSIYELQTDAVASKTDGLNVTIKARSNQ